jgi:preprotein translocase subunit SecG
MTSFTFFTLATVFVIACVVLVLLVLIQRGRGGGLSGAFGGAGGNTAFGSKTGDVLTWATSVVFVLFVLLSMGLVWSGNAYNAGATQIIPAAADEPVISDEVGEPVVNPVEETGQPAGLDTQNVSPAMPE